MVTEQLKIQHLKRRAGFGDSIKNLEQGPFEQFLKSIFTSNSVFEEIYLPDEERVTTSELLKMTPEERKEILDDLAANIKKLNLEWLKIMGSAKGQLREKMAFFWHGHFAVRVRGFAQVESYINTVRKYALGNFGDLLMAVSKEPAMLRFLNNVQNKKNSPNENFAREVMELFTLGRGNYTENDIKEAARAFTGWGIDEDDTFLLKENQHDFGNKTIFGKTGNWSGEDVIKMILARKETAVFVVRKIYKFFVNENVDEIQVKLLAEKFFKDNYNITNLMKSIFESDWFYAPQNISCNIKSPIELLVGLNKTFGISYENPQALLAVQRVLGQMLFFPPNVAGWAGGRNWIDNSTLITRMNLPKRLAEAADFDVAVKDDMNDESPGIMRKASNKNALICSFNWELFYKRFELTKEDVLWKTMCEYLLSPITILEEPEYLKSQKFDSKSSKIKTYSLYIVRLPEYQLT
jgi:uncharacterized protein (DUF1800 family)